MKKIIIFILIVGIVYGVYFYFSKNNQDFRCGDGFRFVPSTQTCEPVDKPVEERKLDLSQVEINIPETDVKIKLIKDAKGEVYSVSYKNPEDPESSTIRGFISINAKEIINFSPDFAVAPLFFNSGGTGNFNYIVLFDIKNNKHLSSIFVGDRIEIGSIDIINEKIRVHFKNRLDSESFVIEPTIPTEMVLEIKDNKLSEVMKLQNSDYNDVELKSPIAGSTISVPFLLKGSIPGTWYFEASAQLKILDELNNEIAFGNIQALSDWMTTQRVPFEVNFSTSTLNYKGKATIIIQSENVQGGEEGERLVKKMMIPVVIK